jgi:hypothetical protein
MSRGRVVQILFVEEDANLWPRAEAFFQQQLELVGAWPEWHPMRRLPKRAAGFELISLDGRGLISALLEHRDLRLDLRRTAIVNLHAEAPGPVYGHLRLLLDRPDEGTRSDGLWVFPQSWMAPWFQEALEFPELGLLVGDRPANRRHAPDRTRDRRSPRPAQFLLDPLLPSAARS